MILYRGDTVATYKRLDISLEYDGIFQEHHSIRVLELYTGTTAISYTKLIFIHYETLSKKYTTWKIEVSNLSFYLLQGLLVLLLGKKVEFASGDKEFYNPTSKKVLTTINSMDHQLFAENLNARDIYP